MDDFSPLDLMEFSGKILALILASPSPRSSRRLILGTLITDVLEGKAIIVLPLTKKKKEHLGADPIQERFVAWPSITSFNVKNI